MNFTLDRKRKPEDSPSASKKVPLASISSKCMYLARHLLPTMLSLHLLGENPNIKCRVISMSHSDERHEKTVSSSLDEALKELFPP